MLKKELEESERQEAQVTLSEGYENSLKTFNEEYKGSLDELKKDRKALYELVHHLIDEIVVYTRPLKKDDKIAGVRKKDQQVPFRLHIKLKLPQDILHDLYEKSSGYDLVSGGR